MTILVLALLIGVVAGLRAMTAPAAVAWAAHLGWLPLAGTPLAFLGHPAAPWVLGALALVELVTDQLPKTPSRKVPVQFGTRILTGALSAAPHSPRLRASSWPARPAVRSARCSARSAARRCAPGWPPRSAATCRPR